MDQKDLLVRAKNRRSLVHLAQTNDDDIASEIGMYWLQELARDWNPEVNPDVPRGLPVGDAFKNFVDDWVKRSKHRARKFDWYVKNLTKEVAHWINTNDVRVTGIDYPNPIDGVEKKKEDGYRLRAASVKQAETVYGPVLHEDRHRNMYSAPDEHPRTCPEHPGANLKRISDGVYQCLSDGENYSIEGGHEVTFQRGVHNQTNPGWNESWPQPAFLSRSQQSWEDPVNKSYGVEKKTADPDKPYPDQESNPSDPQVEWTDAAPSEYGGLDGREGGESTTEAASVRGFVKQAQEQEQATYQVQVHDHVFGPVQVQTRYCPDHGGVNLYRVADKVFQCPLDRKVYNFEQGFTKENGEVNTGGSVANMTPDVPGYYNSGYAFIAAQKGVKGLAKQAGKPDSVIRQFKERTNQWLAENTPLEQAKAEFLGFAKQTLGPERYDATEEVVLGHPNNPNDEGISNLMKLVEYVWNLLLKFEGEGVLRTSLKGISKEAFSNVDNRFAFDLSHALAGDSSSRRLLELVVEGVVKAGKDLRQAIRDAYMIAENGRPQETQQPEVPVAPEMPAGPEMPANVPGAGQLM